MSDFGLYGSGFGLIGQGKLLTKCGGFTCPCELLTGTNCACYVEGATPDSYIVVFDDLTRVCLSHFSGCEWHGVTSDGYGVTLDLNYLYTSSYRAKLIVRNLESVIVFYNTWEGTCDERKSGMFTNILTDQNKKWNTAIYYSECYNGICPARLIKVEYDFNKGRQWGVDYNEEDDCHFDQVLHPDTLTQYSFLEDAGGYCHGESLSAGGIYDARYFDRCFDLLYDCGYQPYRPYYRTTINYNATSKLLNLKLSFNTYPADSASMFLATGNVDLNTMPIGASAILSNAKRLKSWPPPQYPCSSGHLSVSQRDFAWNIHDHHGNYSLPVGGTAKITTY